MHTGTWGGAEALARLQAHNAEVSHMRGRIERVFGTMKRSYGLRRMCWLGLAQGRPAGQADGDGLQPAPRLAPAGGRAGVSHAWTLPTAWPNALQWDGSGRRAVEQ